MSCGKDSCNSGGCHTSDHPKDPRRQALNPDLCVKCKLIPPLSGAGAADDARFCSHCFRANLFAKFRLTVTSNAMISPTDTLLVAFSAGPCSRLALQFVHDLQLKAQNNFDASRDKSLPVFGVGIAFIDESFARSIPTPDDVIQHIKSVVDSLSSPHKELHVAPLEYVYSPNVADARSRLTELLDTVVDPTGKDDFLTHLRMLCLQKIAVENGYNKLVLGSCTSTIARHVLSASVKGQGYSLPADIQYVDARWEIPVLLPLRDCLAQELNTLCQLDGLKTISMVNGPQSGINALISSFVSLLQEENPSRECTIVRTAAKLTPFSFNKLPVVDDPKAYLASQRRQKKFNMKSNESSPAESFCSICYSPLHESDFYKSGSSAGAEQTAEGFQATCCSSCRFQILPADSSHVEQFFSLLPQPLISRPTTTSSSCVQRLLRESIQDFLLSDSEDGS